MKFAKPRITPAALPSLRRMVFGNAWYERWAKESPSITSSGRVDSAGLPILAARLLRPVPPPVGRVDRSVFGTAVVPAVFDDRRRRFVGAPSTWNSAECGRDADRHRVPNGSACSPKTCTSALWDGAREWRRSSPAREGADTQRGSHAAAERYDPRTSLSRCRGLSAQRCNLQ